ncbi:MAG: hypothetical protein Q6365_002805 [Candidatus Sigynarchaeota archaeon]
MIKIDASSLIYLLRMNFIDVLVKFENELVITKAVHDEVVIRGKNKGRADAFICEKLIHEGRITVHDHLGYMLNVNLGPGEQETIQNAMEKQCSCVLDDQKALRMATSMGVAVKQVPFLMLEALKKNVISSIEFDAYFKKWVHHADPPAELHQLIKSMKELLA